MSAIDKAINVLLLLAKEFSLLAAMKAAMKIFYKKLLLQC